MAGYEDRSAQILATLADVRSDIDDGTAPATIYVDSATGSDETGDGSAGLPYATLAKAVAVLPKFPTSSRTIQLVGAGPYEFPGLSTGAINFVTIQGDTPTTLDSRTIDSVGSSSQANGLVLTDTDTAMTVDQHRGQLVQFTSGTLNTQYGIIYENGTNQIEVTQDTQGSTFKVPAATDTYDILDWVTEVTFPLGQSYILESCGSTAFRHIKFTGTSKFLFVADTDKVDFQRCRFEITSCLASRGGSMFFTTCSVANAGVTFKNWGMFTAITGGIIEMKKGTVVDAVNATTADYISILDLSMLQCQGDIVFRDLGASGVIVRSGVVSTVRDREGTLFAHWRFVDCAGGVGAIAGSNGEGWGWASCDLPDLYGNITGNFAVHAAGGAMVRLGGSSSVSTATVTNAVTTDGTNNRATDTDGTLVVGGDPAGVGAGRVYSATFENADLVGGDLTVDHNLDQQYVAVRIFNNTDVEVSPDSVTATSADQATVDLTSQGTLTGTWRVVVVG